LENHHVKDIGRLLQLRYLNISQTGISALPKQIGDLEYLETLDLLWTKLDELPKSITRLKRLARLFVYKDTKLPDGVGNMKNLQELWTINPLKQSLEFVEELHKLTNLEKLGITWDTTNGNDSEISKEQKLVASLYNLDRCKLHTLHIEFHSSETNAAFTAHPSLSALNSIREITVGRWQFREIIKCMVPLINLVKLNTRGVEIEKRDLEMVGSIPTLLYLDLDNKKSCVKSTINGVGFQQLHTLQLNMAVRWLVFEAGAMPNLKRLCILVELDKLEFSGGFEDFGLHHLSRLDTVSIAFLSVDLKSLASIQESAMADFRSMVDAHPNRPTLHFGRV
jgi:Leucine-rich repeat (LRR) protein